MTTAVRIHPCSPVDGTIQPPGSKSITNRALVCAALATGRSELLGVLASEDTEVMITAWQTLGLDLQVDHGAARLTIEGCGGRLPIQQAELFIGNSGTTIRFLTAALAACHGRFVLDGVPRMHERPIGDLLNALQQLGGNVLGVDRARPDYPPVLVQGVGLRGGSAAVAGNISSQFLSGLMMAAPLAEQDVVLEVSGELVSVPYVEITRRVMEAFGASVIGPATGPLLIDASQKYRATCYSIEPDASAASYFWGAAAITHGRARVLGLSRSSLQGDVRFCEVLQQMGCHVRYEDDAIEVIGGELQGVDVNMADISDTVQTLAAVALFANGPTTVRGVAHNRVKETDRIGDLARELRKLGADVHEFDDGLTIHPPSPSANSSRPILIETYGDHRMAMSLALAGLRVPDISILDPHCTAKTYPGYWDDLSSFAECRIERLD